MIFDGNLEGLLFMIRSEDAIRKHSKRHVRKSSNKFPFAIRMSNSPTAPCLVAVVKKERWRLRSPPQSSSSSSPPSPSPLLSHGRPQSRWTARLSEGRGQNRWRGSRFQSTATSPGSSKFPTSTLAPTIPTAPTTSFASSPQLFAPSGPRSSSSPATSLVCCPSPFSPYFDYFPKILSRLVGSGISSA